MAYYKEMVESKYGEGSWDDKSNGRESLSEYYKKLIIDDLIVQRLFIDAAAKDGIKISDEELKKQIDEHKSYFKTDEEYQTYLKTNEITEEILFEAIEKDYTINQYLQKNVYSIVPTEDDLKKLYEDVKMGTEVRASHILVKTEEEAKSAIDRLNKGEKFEDVAKDVSTDPSKDNGGDLNFFPYTQMVKEFSDAAFSMNIGDVSGAVKTEYGYHIIKVTDKKTDDTVTFENSKENLTQIFTSYKYRDLVENLKKNAKIETK